MNARRVTGTGGAPTPCAKRFRRSGTSPVESVTDYLYLEYRVGDQPIFNGLNVPDGTEAGHTGPGDPSDVGAGPIAPAADPA